jgi:hypothetical protein
MYIDRGGGYEIFGMGEIQKLQDEIIDLQNKLYALVLVKEEIWMYHPSNPNFINPISLYETLKEDICNIERKINDLEFRINSLN